MYTKVQICSHFGISPRTFDVYRRHQIIGKPHVDGNTRYYTTQDLRRVRDLRTQIDQKATIADYAERHPHPDSPPPLSFDDE